MIRERSYSIRPVFYIAIVLSFLLALSMTACEVIPFASANPPESTTRPPEQKASPAGVQTDTPVITQISYTNNEYGFGFVYPSDWSLEEISARTDQNGKNTPYTLVLRDGSLLLMVQVKISGDDTNLGMFDLPAGEVEERSVVEFFETEIPKNLLVFEEKDQAVFFESQGDTLEFFILLEDDPGPGYDYREISLSEAVQSEADQILSSFTSSGESVQPPLPEGKPVTAWTGHVRSTPPGEQLDDYLVLMPEGAGEIGITGYMPELESVVVDLRDKEGVGEYATFWGSLICPAIDYGGCQLIVTDVKYGLYKTEPEVVDGWEGIVVCSHFNASPDDVCGNAFQLNGDFPVWYGLWSTDPGLLEQLESLRGTGVPILVWGQIITGVPDVNGTQIQLERIKVLGEVTQKKPTPSATPIPAASQFNAAEFIADITINDGSVFIQGLHLPRSGT